MDRNSIIGLLLIGLIFIGFSLWQSNQQLDEDRIKEARRDSLMQYQKAHPELQVAEDDDTSTIAKPRKADEVTEELAPLEIGGMDTLPPSKRDSLKNLLQYEKLKDKFGAFANAARGDDRSLILENELIKVSLSTLGGRVESVELKDFQTYDSLPLVLFQEEHSSFGLDFTHSNRFISTKELYFTPTGESFTVSGENSQSIGMRLYAGDEKYIEYLYTLRGNSYDVDMTVNVVGMEDVIARNMTFFNLDWSASLYQKEKALDVERQRTTVNYKFMTEDVDDLSASGDDQEDIAGRLKWVAFTQQYFTSVLIAENSFDTPAKLSIKAPEDEDTTDVLKHMAVSVALNYNHTPSQSYPMKWYFGPLHYSTLADHELDLEDQIPLGWGIFGWVNKFIVIPIFNVLDGFNMNYGIIILILTLIIKLALSPITYKTYLSSAKMRVLKPEIEELNKKFGDSDPLKKQQAMMSLYKRTGVNPLAGCVPQLIQLPILYAMFRFFPASIELRQESFLWADDLSSYDSIFSWEQHIPLISDFYGNHISLFTLLMAVSMYGSMKLNSGQMTTSGPQMKQMQIMMNIMPVFLLVFFNSYSSGLSYYYLLANIITILQQVVIKKFIINEDDIRRKIEEYKKKPVSKKKSGFQKRLEDMAKQRGYQPPRKK